ncbi:unnamed protein product [marine sediment metagenome]|uniref:Uncharacterized protein n=2 Tax=marine sediment metagenome TaxID=412755 RepID=X1LLW2_9ZZZZ
MSFTEKIDVLDLLINVLREHEEKLDELVERMEQIICILNLESFSQNPETATP